MSSSYHTPLPANAALTRFNTGGRLSELDTALYELRNGLFLWQNLAAAPGDPAADHYRLYVRSSSFAFRDSDGNETLFVGEAGVLLADVKAENNGGGAFANGAWRTRDLNTEVYDPNGLCSLAANQFTLEAGTYRVRAYVPAWSVDSHQARLQNTTAATTLLTGTSAYIAQNGVGTPPSPYSNSASFIGGQFTVAAGQALEIQHQCLTSEASTLARGVPSILASGFTELYTLVELRKV